MNVAPHSLAGGAARALLLGALSLLAACHSTPALDTRFVPGAPADRTREPQQPAEQEQQDGEPDYSEGMNDDGSIPRGALPSDIKHPDRWRYVPEGRLVEGSFFDRFFLSSFAFPVFAFDEVSGFTAGLAVTDVNFLNSRQRDFFNLALTYSSEGQRRYVAYWRRFLHHRDLEGGGAIMEERGTFQLGGGYGKTLTRRFYGLGSGTNDTDQTRFSDEVVGLSARLQDAIPDPGDDLVFHLGATAEYHDLGAGAGAGRDTRDVFPMLFDAADDYGIFWLHGGIRLDSRDSEQNPYRGAALGFEVDYAPIQSDGNVGGRLRTWGTAAFEVPSFWHDGGEIGEENPPTDTLVVNAFMNWSQGDLPFWGLPALGGNNSLRGYVANRWIDRAAWHASIEYRFWPIARGLKFSEKFIIERLGMAFFYDIGTVADEVGAFDDAKIRDSYGVSFRCMMARTMVFRIDIGFSDEGSNVLVAYGLPY